MDIFSTTYSDKEGLLLASNSPKKRAGRKKFRETRHPVYRGVRSRNLNKWVSEVREPNKKSRIWLGTFPTAEMAARAHDVAVLALRGKSACLNFADSAWRLPVPISTEAKDIQKAAFEAAEAFRSPETLIYIDEEAVFGQSDLLINMSEGLLISPPTYLGNGDDNEEAKDIQKAAFEAAEAFRSPETLIYIDEEAVFGQSDLLINMAEGLLISPPTYLGNGDDDDEEILVDASLWNYSF